MRSLTRPTTRDQARAIDRELSRDYLACVSLVVSYLPTRDRAGHLDADAVSDDRRAVAGIRTTI
jgi:hypothetical protein